MFSIVLIQTNLLVYMTVKLSIVEGTISCIKTLTCILTWIIYVCMNFMLLQLITHDFACIDFLQYKFVFL